ncbi:MAG: type II secretion system F family protein [Planctomycetota bacterium]|nr:type II secretion system F family protein [Planctomycetota bacterium]
MDLLLPILVAAIVALLAFAGASIAAPLLNPDRKKLQSRLALDPSHRAASAAGGFRTVTHQLEVDSVTAALVRFAPLAALNARLVQAFPDASLAVFLGISIGGGLLGMFVAFAIFGTVLLGLAGGAAAALAPLLVLLGKRGRRQRVLGDQLPEALDFLSRVLKAGHSFSTGLQMLGDELPKPLSGEFRKAYDQHTLGQSVEDALKDMAKRIDSGDFAFFVTAVLIQRQTGGDLSEVLKNIGGMIRSRVRLQQHVKSKTAEGRFTGYVLVAFPLVMFVLLSFMNPKYAHTLTSTSTGHKLLGLALTLQMLGLYAIRRITTIKV